jgi:hypothetical protein
LERRRGGHSRHAAALSNPLVSAKARPGENRLGREPAPGRTGMIPVQHAPLTPPPPRCPAAGRCQHDAAELPDKGAVGCCRGGTAAGGGDARLPGARRARAAAPRQPRQPAADLVLDPPGLRDPPPPADLHRGNPGDVQAGATRAWGWRLAHAAGLLAVPARGLGFPHLPRRAPRGHRGERLALVPRLASAREGVPGPASTPGPHHGARAARATDPGLARRPPRPLPGDVHPPQLVAAGHR